MKTCSRPTRKSSPATKSCKAPTKNSKPPRKNCSPPTKSLSTVNDELRTRNADNGQIDNDLTNVLSSIDIAVVMVSSDLTMRRFTSRAQELLGLIPADVGRPLWNINPSLEIPKFQQMALEVISSFRPVEKELNGKDGVRYQLRILPYRTADDKVDGAVITFYNVSESSQSSQVAGKG